MFTTALHNRLLQHNVPLREVRLNGSAASHVVSDKEEEESMYNDLDFVFLLDSPTHGDVDNMFELVRLSFLECLLELVPQGLRAAFEGTHSLYLYTSRPPM